MLLSFLTLVFQVFFTLKLVLTFLLYPVLSTADLGEEFYLLFINRRLLIRLLIVLLIGYLITDLITDLMTEDY